MRDKACCGVADLGAEGPVDQAFIFVELQKMLNNRFRTSLTRDEIIGVLLGWLKGPDIPFFPEEMEIGPNEQEALEVHSYSVCQDWKERADTAWEKYAECLERGEEREKCRKFVDNFGLEEEAFKRICDQVDDEISKGKKSMLRVDHRTSTAMCPCYTRISVDEWIAHGTTALLSKGNFHLNKKTETCKAPSKALNTKTGTSKLQQQTDLILKNIRDLGVDPMSLPPAPPEGGVRSKIEGLLNGKPPFEKATAFKHAWTRLRKSGQIKGGEAIKG